MADEDGRVAPHLFAAGDVIESRPRTMLEAIRSGARAGRSAQLA
jgi:thioredoxin reductase